MPNENNECEILYAKGSSRCCNCKMRLVQSRAGGFVSSDCEGCGWSRYVRVGDLPELSCKCCRHPLIVRFLDGKNYFYVCRQCDKAWKLASILPHWSRYFTYWGLAAPGDGSYL